MKGRCIDCRFWDTAMANSEGLCHRYAHISWLAGQRHPPGRQCPEA